MLSSVFHLISYLMIHLPLRIFPSAKQTLDAVSVYMRFASSLPKRSEGTINREDATVVINIHESASPTPQ
jgi:hypothetical protein